VKVGEQVYGNGVGRSKKEAEQAAAETAYGELATSLGIDDPVAEKMAAQVIESADD
jgi:ribonuclease III